MGHFPIQFRGKELERKLRPRQLSCLLGSDEVAELEFIRYELWGLWGHGDGSDPAQTLAHLLPSHGFEHLLQLNSQLLSVVHEDAGLQMGKEEGVRAQDLSPGPPPRASLTPPLPGTSDGYRVCVWRKLGSHKVI